MQLTTALLFTTCSCSCRHAIAGQWIAGARGMVSEPAREDRLKHGADNAMLFNANAEVSPVVFAFTLFVVLHSIQQGCAKPPVTVLVVGAYNIASSDITNRHHNPTCCQ
jgi:hypothetical protein